MGNKDRYIPIPNNLPSFVDGRLSLSTLGNHFLHFFLGRLETISQDAFLGYAFVGWCGMCIGDSEPGTDCCT